MTDFRVRVGCIAVAVLLEQDVHRYVSVSFIQLALSGPRKSPPARDYPLGQVNLQ